MAHLPFPWVAMPARGPPAVSVGRDALVAAEMKSAAIPQGATTGHAAEERSISFCLCRKKWKKKEHNSEGTEPPVPS